MNFWISIFIAVLLYSVLGTIAYYRNKLPDGLKILGPITVWRTQYGIHWFDSTVRKHPTTWRKYGTIGAIVAVITLLLASILVIGSGIFTALYPQPESAAANPVNMLVIPGVSEFLPLSVAPEILLGIIIGLVVHEGGHGIMCRVAGIDVKSVGVTLLGPIPLGAFVEPNEDTIENASRSDTIRMFAAGVMNNFVVTAVVLILLLGPVLGAISVAPGAGIGAVTSSSGGDTAGLEKGDRILSVNGTAIETNEEYKSYIESSSADTLEIETDSKTTTLDRSLVVTSAAQSTGIAPESIITHVNDEPISTIPDFQETLKGESSVTLTTSTGEEHTLRVGALTSARENGPAAEAGIPVESAITITHIGGEQVLTHDDISAIVNQYEPGETVPVTFVQNEQSTTVNVTFGESTAGNTLLGVQGAPGTNGVVMSDDGIELYPAEDYLTLLRSGPQEGNAVATSPAGHLLTYLQLPAIEVSGAAPYNFAGFTDGVQNLYTVDGPFNFAESSIFILANILFWLGWLNIALAIFNCIPLYPLDGGHILRELIEGGTERLPLEETTQTKLARSLSIVVMGVMFLSLVMLVFGPRYIL